MLSRFAYSWLPFILGGGSQGAACIRLISGRLLAFAPSNSLGAQRLFSLLGQVSYSAHACTHSRNLRPIPLAYIKPRDAWEAGSAAVAIMHHVKTTAICRHTHKFPVHSGLRRYALNLALDVSLDARSISAGDLNDPRLACATC